MRAINNRPTQAAAVVLVLLAIAGCGGDGLTRIAAYGTVNVDDQALERGVVKFVPLPGVEGPAVFTEIRDGEYAFDDSNGPVPGEHAVEVYVDQPLTPGLDDPEEYVRQGGPQGRVQQPPNPIDARFNRQTVLRAAPATDGENRFDFNVFTTR